MKKINLRGISEFLNDSEMKDVKGGSQNPDGGDNKNFLLDDGTGGIYKEEEESPKVKACKGKKIGDSCQFKDDRNITQYGRCQSFLWQPLHCSDLN